MRFFTKSLSIVPFLGLAMILPFSGSGGSGGSSINLAGGANLSGVGSPLPRILFPVTFNAANYTRIEATSTCGLDIPEGSEEIYCQLVGASIFKTKLILEGQSCDVCEASKTNSSHLIERALDQKPDTWWMSPPLSRHLKYQHVNVTLSFNQPYEISYMIVHMANTPRPDVWLLEKSQDFGRNWLPWQYFTTSEESCRDYFPHAPRAIEEDDSVICSWEHSGIFPLEAGEIPISFMKGRPASLQNEITQRLLNFMTATNVRLRFLKPSTVSGQDFQLTARPNMARRIFYSLSELDILARCICNGHADRCLEDSVSSLEELAHRLEPATSNQSSYSSLGGSNSMKGYRHQQHVNRPNELAPIRAHLTSMKCHCQHNTEGEHCQRCKRPYIQKRWRPAYSTTGATSSPATGGSYGSFDGVATSTSNTKRSIPFECEPCNCHGHAHECEYNATVDDLHLSQDIAGRYEGGGVCIGCQHHTTGINCNQCIEGYYHPRDRSWSHPEACVECDCDRRFTTGKCDQNGHCECLSGQEEQKQCSTCKERFYGNNLKRNCRPCQCNWSGAIGCDATTGECFCRPHVEGARCDQCQPNHFGLELGLGCRPCQCSQGSISSQCHPISGQCECWPGVEGRTCQQCDSRHFAYNSTIGQCKPCKCHAELSLWRSAQQQHGTHKLSSESPSKMKSGAEDERLCDLFTGQCQCKPNVEGLQCDRCRTGHVLDKEGSGGCKPCDECTEPLFSQLELVKTTLEDTIVLANQSRTKSFQRAKLNKWKRELDQLESYFVSSKDQLMASVAEYSRQLDTSDYSELKPPSSVPTTTMIHNMNSTTKKLITTTTMKDIKAPGRLWHHSGFMQMEQEPMKQYQHLIEMVSDIRQRSAAVGLLVRTNGSNFEQGIRQILDRYNQFMEDLEEQVLDDELRNDCNSCRWNESPYEEKLVQALEARMNETQKWTLAAKQDTLAALDPPEQKIKRNEIRLRFHQVANVQPMQINETLASCREALEQLLSDYDSLDGTIENQQEVIRRHLKPNYIVDSHLNNSNGVEREPIMKPPRLIMVGAMKPALEAYERIKGQLEPIISKVNELNKFTESIVKKAALVEFYVASNETRLQRYDQLSQWNTTIKQQLRHFRQLKSKLIEMRTKANSEEAEMAKILGPCLTNFVYLMKKAPVVYESLRQLHELTKHLNHHHYHHHQHHIDHHYLHNEQEHKEQQLKHFNLRRAAINDSSVELESARNRWSRMETILVEMSNSTETVTRRLQKIRHLTNRALEASEATNNENISVRDQVVLHRLQLERLVKANSKLRKRSTRNLLEQTELRQSFQWTSQRYIKLRSVIWYNKTIRDLMRNVSQKSIANLKTMRMAEKVNQSPIVEAPKVDEDINKADGTNEVYNLAWVPVDTSDLARKMNTLKTKLNRTRSKLKQLQIGATFNGTQCVRLRPTFNTNALMDFSTEQTNHKIHQEGFDQQQQQQQPYSLNISLMVRTGPINGSNKQTDSMNLLFLGMPRLRRTMSQVELAITDNNINSNDTIKISSRNRVLDESQFDNLLALSIQNGKLVLVAQCNGHHVTKQTNFFVADNRWHRIRFELTNSTRGISKQSGGADNNEQQQQAKGTRRPFDLIKVRMTDDKGVSVSVSNKLVKDCQFERPLEASYWCPIASLYVGSGPPRIGGQNFIGQIYDLHMNGQKLNVWNTDTNGVVLRQSGEYLYKGRSQCSNGGPQWDFVPEDEIADVSSIPNAN